MFTRLIKRTCAVLVAVFALHAGSAQAVPFIWADDFSPRGGIVVGPQLNFMHNITGGDFGFRPGIDTISNAFLNIVLADDALFGDLPILGDGQETVSFNFDGTGWTGSSSVGLLDLFSFQFDTLLNDGVLGISIRATQGDFRFLSSSLVVTGNRAVGVAEPASMALLGLGLIGLAWASSRRRLPAQGLAS